MQEQSLIGKLSLSPVNQARSMMLAGLSVAPEEIADNDRQAHVQVMKMVIPSLFLRTPLAVLGAVGISLLAGAASLPALPSEALSWMLVFALPSVVIVLWFALLFWRLSQRSIREVLAPTRSDVPLMYISLLGYLAAAAVSVVGLIAFPEAFR